MTRRKGGFDVWLAAGRLHVQLGKRVIMEPALAALTLEVLLRSAQRGASAMISSWRGREEPSRRGLAAKLADGLDDALEQLVLGWRSARGRGGAHKRGCMVISATLETGF
jgi:hypothetical protein